MIKRLSKISSFVGRKKTSLEGDESFEGSEYESDSSSSEEESTDDSSDDEFAGSSGGKFQNLLFKMMLRSQKRAPITEESARILLSRAGQDIRNVLFLPWLGKSRSIELDVCSAKVYRSLVYKDKALAALAADISEDMKREMKILEAKYRKRAGDPAGDIAFQVRAAHEEAKLRYAKKQMHISMRERRQKVKPNKPIPGPPGVSEMPWYASLSSKGNEQFFDYLGEWQDGYMDGHGVFHFADGGEYNGKWEKGKPHGPGKAVYATGDVYEGQWKEGRYHGKGTFSYANGAVYEGSWQKGKRHGLGKLTYKNGRCYEGRFQSGFKHGRGKETSRTGFDNLLFGFEGNWSVNRVDGPGTFTKLSGEKEVRSKWEGDGLNELVEILEAEDKQRYIWKAQDRDQLLGPMFDINLFNFVQATRKRIARERADIKAQEKEERKKAALEKKEAARKLKDQFRNQMIDEYAAKAPP